MKCYIEITLLPSGDITSYFLWGKVYQQLHLALVEIQDSNHKVKVGISFPDYDADSYQLGCKLRLFSQSREVLERLNVNKWFSRLSDYTHITSIRDVPEPVDGHAFFKRVQPKSSNERLARRKAKREGVSYEQALAHYDGRKEQRSKAPFVYIKSQSSGERYRLLIDRLDAEVSQVEGRFSTYGLSSSSSVPLF